MTDLRESVAKAKYEKKRAGLLKTFGDTSGWPKWEALRPTLKEIEMEECDFYIAIVLEEAAAFTRAQAQAFRDDAHNRKQFGDNMMHKRGLAVAAYFDQHAAAIRALGGKKHE